MSVGPPGTRTLTAIPASASSAAQPADAASSAALAPPYGPQPRRSMVKKLVVTDTTRPRPRARKRGAAARVMKNAPAAFTAKTRLQNAGSISSRAAGRRS